MALAQVNVAVTSMVVLAFLIPLAFAVQHLARDRALAAAQRQTAVVAAVLTVTTDPGQVESALSSSTGTGRTGQVAVHGLGAQPVGVSRAGWAEARRAADRRSSAVVPVPGGTAYLEPIDLGGGGTAVVEVFVPDAELSTGVARAWLVLGAVAAFLMVASVLAGDRLAARVVRSARALADAARRLGGGDLGVRVPTRGPRELAEAGYAFNAMGNRIADLLAAEREFVADLSHRLRTPLTALRLEAERVRAGAPADRLGPAVAAMESEVDTLIRTARRTSQRLAPEPQACDAAEVVRERMAFWSAVAEDQARPVRVLGTDARSPVPVSRTELAAALDALLSNVFRYTPQGCPFEVTLSRRGGHVAIRVDDAGPGIDDPDRALRRGASLSGSTGLGLDIVRRVATAGRGTVTIGRATLGGAGVEIELADAEREPTIVGRPWLGLVSLLSRDSGERRWSRATPPS